MVRRVSKVRKSAVLEHLLDLERQIRRELARASAERQAMAKGERQARTAASDEAMGERGERAVPTEVVQRYLH